MENTAAKPKPKIFLYLDGIKGSVTSPAGYEGWIALETLSMGAGMGISTRGGRWGRNHDDNGEKKKEEDPLDAHPEVSEPSMSEMSASRKGDDISVHLFALMISRKRTSEAKVAFLLGDELKFLFTLNGVIMSSLSQSTSASGDDAKSAKSGGSNESFSLNYQQITYGNGGHTATYNIYEQTMSYDGNVLNNYEGRNEEQFVRYQAKQAIMTDEEKKEEAKNKRRDRGY